VTLTVHPSSILLAPDSSARAESFRQFVNDRRYICRLAAGRRHRPELRVDHLSANAGDIDQGARNAETIREIPDGQA
jgi:hypothetical protein